MDRQTRVWLGFVTGLLLTLTVGCGGGAAVTGPTDGPTVAQTPAVAPLAVPTRLRAVWAPADRAAGAVARLQANAVLLQVDSWGDDLTGYARWSRERGVGAIPYIGQCFEGTRASWDSCWASVERWSRSLREAGVLWGFQGVDEPALNGQVSNGVRDASNAYIRAKGFDVFAVEWIEYATDQRKDAQRRPAGVRWYGVTCYAYQSRTPWHVENCAAEYARHPDWDTVIIPDGRDDLNRAAGYPYSRAQWEAIAGSGRSVAFYTVESK